MRVSGRLEQFPEYVFSRLNREMGRIEAASGRRVKNLGIGSPDVPPSPVYLDILNEFSREKGAHLYPGYAGILEFREAVAAWYKKRFGAYLAAAEVLPLLGAKDGVAHLPLALADEGSEILMPDPGYPGFAGAALLMGAKPSYYGSLGELERKISKETAFVWVNFPSNPTGEVVTLDDLEKIVDLAKKHGTPIVYDNAYSEITFDGYVAPSILQIGGAKDIAVELGSFSKTFSFAGFRMGWLAGNKAIVDALQKVKSQTDSGMSLPLQRLGAYALNNQDLDWHNAMVATYRGRRDVIAAKLRKLGLTFDMPKGSLYIWARIPEAATDSESYVMGLLEQQQVLLAPGSAFGQNGERYVRASICVDVGDIDEYLD